MDEEVRVEAGLGPRREPDPGRLIARSEDVGEVHVHGYDLSRAVSPGEPARIGFVADIAGRFEVELEESGVQIADLTVRP